MFFTKAPKQPVPKEGDLFSYAREFADIRISRKDPFNEVDAAVLCRISYLQLEGVISSDFSNQLSINGLAIKLLQMSKGKSIGVYEKKDIDLLRILENASRYKDMKVCGFRSSFSLKKQEQFAACTILMNPKTCFVSFRGTDATLNGWREDFDLGILGNIPSHKDAYRYAREAMGHFPGRKFYLGGHSKGGNLAAFVAMNLPAAIEKRQLLKVFVIDGPGFRRDVLLQGRYKAVAGKVVSLAPVQSIVGMILYSPFPAVPVKSKGLFVFQHDVFLWRVQGTCFVKGSFDPSAYALKRWTKEVFEGMDVQTIKFTLDSLFGCIAKQFGETVSDMFNHPWRALLFFATGMRGLDEKPKKILNLIGKMYMSSFRSANMGNDQFKKSLPLNGPRREETVQPDVKPVKKKA